MHNASRAGTPLETAPKIHPRKRYSNKGQALLIQRQRTLHRSIPSSPNHRRHLHHRQVHRNNNRQNGARRHHNPNHRARNTDRDNTAHRPIIQGHTTAPPRSTAERKTARSPHPERSQKNTHAKKTKNNKLNRQNAKKGRPVVTLAGHTCCSWWRLFLLFHGLLFCW